MSSNVKVLNYGDIRVISPYEIKSIDELQILSEVNEHIKLHLTGMLPEEKKEDYISETGLNDEIEIDCTDENESAKSIFKGAVSNITVKAVQGIYYLEIEALSHTFDLDVKLKSRSFQNKNMTYDSMIQKVTQDYPRALCINEAAYGKQIGRFILQYNETDWEFLKRQAAYFGDVLVADVSSNTPRFYFGVPDMSESINLDNFNYRVKRDLKSCMNITENLNGDSEEIDFTYYEVEGFKPLNIGQKVNFYNKDLIVSKVTALMENGVLKYEYSLASKKGICQNFITNTAMIGVSLEGEIIDTANDTVKLHLDIDDSQNKSEACFFPYSSSYAPDGGVGWYCMPQAGDHVKLYIPNENEDEAIAVSSVRKGEGGGKMSDPDSKYLGTSSGKEMMLGGNELSFTAKEGALFIKLNNESGIEIQSDKDIQAMSKKDLTINSDESLSINSKEGIYLICKESSIALSGKTDIRGNKIVTEGYIKAPVTVVDDPEDLDDAPQKSQGLKGNVKKVAAKGKSAKKVGDKGIVMDAVQFGLDVVGMVPGPIGIAANLVNAGISLARGDKVGAAMSVVSCIPVVGSAMKAEKVAKGAKEAVKVGEEAAKVGKDLEKGEKLAKDAKEVGSLAKDTEKGAKALKEAAKTSKAAKAAKAAAEAAKASKKLKTAGKVITRAITVKNETDAVKGAVQAAENLEGDIANLIRDPKNPRNWLNLAEDTTAIVAVGAGRRGRRGEEPTNRVHEGEEPRRSTSKKREPEHENRNTERNEKTADKKGGNQSTALETNGVDPVNLGTGSFRMDFVDLVMEDIGLPIKIKREYTSQDTSIGSMGRGWSFNFETKLEYGKNESELNLICEDGHVEKFIKNNEKWEAINGSKAFKLSETYKGFILKAKNKKIYTYDEAGKLKEIADRNKNTIKLEYDEAGYLKMLTSPSEKAISFEYNYGKLIEIEDNVGRKVKYTYDKDNLTAVELPNEGVVTYEYTDNLITSVTDQAGKNYVKNKYDHLKRVIWQKSREGNITDIKYDEKNMETVVISHSRGTTIRYRHNYKNLVTNTIYVDGTSESCTYNRWGDKTKETDRNGNIIKNVFDERGNLLEKIYPDGYSIKNEYNEAGDLTRSYSSGGREILYGYDDCGNMLYKAVKISPGYSKTTYTYDSYGRMLTKADPEGNTTTFSYFENEINKPTTVLDPEKDKFNYSYNKTGLVTSIKTQYGTVKFGYNDINRKIKITDAKGNTTRFMYDKMGNLVKKVLPREYRLEVDNGPGYKYRYDALDRRIETIDPLLNVYKVKYDEEGNILKEINPNYLDRGTDDGIGVEYEYDDANRRIKIKYPTGGIKRIKYDSHGNIIKIIEPANYNEKTDDGCGREYEYDNRNRLTVVRNQGKVEKKFIYDIDGRVIKEINAKGYLNAESDELRFGTLYEYNAADWLTEKRVPVSKENGQILYNVTVYKYDLAGRKIEEKRSRQYVKEKEYPEEWNTINYSYDKNSRIIKISDSTGAEINYAYDCLSNRTLEKAKINDSTYKTKRYYYDSIGHLYKIKEEINKEDLAEKTDRLTEAAETLYEYDANGNIIKVVTPEGYESTMTYDAANRLVEIKKAINHGRNYRVTTYEYDKAGNIVKETDGNGNSIKYEYDTMNRQTKIIDKEGGVTRLYYDASGNIIKQITPENYDSSKDDGKGTTYSYDTMNRLVNVTNALGVIVQKNKYNEAGELIEKQDASKTGVNYTYDIGGRIKNIITPKAVENNAVSQEYFYDALGNVTGIKDGEGNQTSYNLDPWGRITEINKADGSREWYNYDYAGNITGTMDGNGNKTEYSYNSLNLLSQIKDPAGDLMTYQYDRQGRLSRQVDRNKNIIEYVYNEDDNLVTKREANSGITESRKYNIDGSLAAAIAGGKAYNYDYTPNGRLKGKSINGKTIIGYDYDKNGNITSITDITGRNVSYKYDVLGRMSEVQAGENKTAFYSYNEDSTVAAIKYANGINIDYFHDADKNISEILAKNAAGEELLNHNYIYDNNGNQIKRTEEGKSTSYIYDSLNRLSKVSYPDYTEVFSYDKAGNRVERNAKGLISKYNYDVRNRLTQIEEAGNFTSFEYDAQGNLLTEKSKQGIKAYTYDCFNRTASVTNSDGSYIKNYYDPEGLRSEINENGDISRFIFDRGNVITELDENDNLKVATIRGLGIVAQIDAERNSYYYLNNYHGDVTAITDASGSVVNSYKYDAFGNTVEANEKVHNRFRYCGEQYDNVSNQYYLKARFYNPVVGRFTQEDVYRGDGLNLYAYVGNNPVNYNDPSGYECHKGDPYENNQKPPNEPPKQLMLPPGNEITDSSRMLPEGEAVKNINPKYRTAIDDSVTVIDKQELPKSLGNTFTDAEYRTVITNKDIMLYRDFGFKAYSDGGFATTSPAQMQFKLEWIVLCYLNGRTQLNMKKK